MLHGHLLVGALLGRLAAVRLRHLQLELVDMGEELAVVVQAGNGIRVDAGRSGNLNSDLGCGGDPSLAKQVTDASDMRHKDGCCRAVGHAREQARQWRCRATTAITARDAAPEGLEASRLQLGECLLRNSTKDDEIDDPIRIVDAGGTQSC